MEKLKEEVYLANMLLPKYSLVTFTWGNVSGIDRESNMVVIKPSGVEYDLLKLDDMAVLDLFTGQQIEGELKPSSDTPTHLELYRSFSGICGIVHTHSRFATIMAQAKSPVRALGTTHADYFYGDVPLVRALTDTEISGDYELNTGKAIAETLAGTKDILAIPAVLVESHGPFCWGVSAHKAVENAVVLEEVSLMAWHAHLLNPSLTPISQTLLDRHYLRKHGENAYYGQN
ncbi:MAG: L-ribulose-5-phosphate 4-epimerase [Oscillospiraceae bacterium]|nr:L-ribulose-5-phosphate 4-epimerase [Oscillospiraceae bacterium]